MKMTANNADPSAAAIIHGSADAAPPEPMDPCAAVAVAVGDVVAVMLLVSGVEMLPCPKLMVVPAPKMSVGVTPDAAAELAEIGTEIAIRSNCVRCAGVVRQDRRDVAGNLACYARCRARFRDVRLPGVRGSDGGNRPLFRRGGTLRDLFGSKK